MRFAEALAKVLGISAAFFYCGDDRLAEIIMLYTDASESKRRLMLESVQELAV